MAREEKTLTELELQPTANVDRENDYLWTVDTSDTSMSAYGTSKKVKVEAFIGDTGPQGDAATIEVGTTTTGDPGTNASVVNSGTESEAVLDFTIPRGAVGATGATGADGEDAFVYIAYASDDSGTGFTTTFNPALNYIAIKSTNTEIANPQASDFTGLWKNYKGEKGDTGATGATGEAGEDAYVYIAYASDDSGTNFTTTFSPTLNYIAIKSTNTEIVSPQASDFTGLWFNYKGEKGDTGETGAAGEDGLDITWRGAYSASTAYVVNDAVYYNGGSYICIQNTTGNLPTNETYWNLMAAQGAPGEGSGDVSGPSSSTDNAVARFDSTTGKLIQNSLVTIDDNGSVNIPAGQQYLVNGSPVEGYSDEQAQDAVGTILTDTAEIDLTYDDVTPKITADIKDASIANAKLANMTSKTYKGRTAGTTGVPEDVPVATLKSDLSLTKSDVGLGNVDNTSDATKNSAVATLTNKTINADNNTISNLETDNLKTGVLDTDLSSVSALDDTLASAKAIKAYTDSKGYTWKGAWATSTSYSVNDTVESNGSGYVCKTAHTSGTFATDLSAGKWELFVEGLPDPNITTSTTTNLTGVITGNGSVLASKTNPSGAFVGTTDTQTLTNKTLGSPLFQGTWDGWIDANETWTYASADDPTYTFTISGDLSGKYSAGMRIKLTQTTAKYFIITKVAYSSPNTTITVYGGTDYDLVNATITNPYYSTQKAPQGFPLDPDKWSVMVSSSVSQDATTNSVSGTVYPVSNLNITIPIGIWNVKYLLNTRVSNLNAPADLKTSFSTSSSSATNTEYSSQMSIGAITTGQIIQSMNNSFALKNTAKTPWYVVMWASLTGCTFGIRGDLLTCYVKATCAYL